jgi:hypothetical protein
MDLTVAIGVEEHSVLYTISATFGTPDDVMVVPPCEFGDFLTTDRTDTLLFLPQARLCCMNLASRCSAPLPRELELCDSIALRHAQAGHAIERGALDTRFGLLRREFASA